ncbi:hypothetical protein WJX79_010638 [Trebouxia sp. C0005]
MKARKSFALPFMMILSQCRACGTALPVAFKAQGTTGRVLQKAQYLAGADALELVCQVTDALCRMQRPSVELLGACIGLMSALARAFPGYAATLASKTYLLGDAFLGLTETLLIAGVNEACVKSYVGFTLSHILSSCHSWRYGKRSQRWDITTAALQAVADAVSRPGHPAAYLFINWPPHAGFLDTLVKRQGREAEAASLERMTAQWLLLLPLLIQACKCLPYPSAFLQDLFQAPAEGKPSAANILASYIAYPFEEVEGKSMGAVALEAGQALAVAASAVSQAQVCLAWCLLQGLPGNSATCPVMEALARCFQYEQAVDNPLAFSAAAELLITAFTAPHPSLLVLLMTGSSVEEATDKAPKKDSRPTCLDGLWEILQHAEELLQSQPDVMAHTLAPAGCHVAVGGVEAFAQPRQQGAASQADVWALLDKWGSNKDAKGLLAASLERYTAPLWGSVASQASGLSQASILTQELYLEAETKLVFMFAFMAHFEADDLAKHTSGHTLLAALWQKVSPLLVAHCRNQGLDPSLSVQAVLEDLGQALVKREPSSADWKELAASACQYRDLVSSGEDTQLSFHGDAQMVLLLHDIRQLHLTDALLQAGTAHHCSTLSRVYGDNYLYDEVQLEDLVGELMVQRTSTGTLQRMLRACSVMSSVQDAQSTAQIMHSQLRHWKPKQAHSQPPLPASAVTSDKQQRPPRSKPAPSRLAQMSSACFSDSHKDAGWPPQLAVAEQLLSIARSWLAYQRTVAPVSLDTTSNAPGAQMLLDEGVADFLPALANWLLSPDGAELMAAAVIIEQGTAHKYGAVSGRCACAELAGMYNRHGHRSPAHQQWCALMSLSGALVRSLGRDDRLDKGIVTLLVVAQERMLAVLTPPDSAQQPLTLALLQEVEKVLFLASSVPHLKGQWQMATQGPSQGPGPGMGGPLAMRQASCVFLEFATLAVNHHNQPPCCPPISPYERSLASTSPQLPIAEAWFKAAAVGSAPQEQPLLWQGPHGSIDQAPVSATGYSCQVAETMLCRNNAMPWHTHIFQRAQEEPPA